MENCLERLDDLLKQWLNYFKTIKLRQISSKGESLTMAKALEIKDSSQMNMFETKEFPSYEEIMDDYAKEFSEYVIPKGDTLFGFWMQTLAGLK